jgi:hypothetical protein
LPRDNDYYYSKINSFKNGIVSTISNQVLIAPQNASDNRAPEINFSAIRVPVYQVKTINLSSVIYEDS